MSLNVRYRIKHVSKNKKNSILKLKTEKINFWDSKI